MQSTCRAVNMGVNLRHGEVPSCGAKCITQGGINDGVNDAGGGMYACLLFLVVGMSLLVLYERVHCVWLTDHFAGLCASLLFVVFVGGRLCVECFVCVWARLFEC